MSTQASNIQASDIQASNIQASDFQPRTISAEDIVDYYDACEIDYRLVWNRGQNIAMHFGYWDETTHNFSEALDRENEVLAKILGIGPQDHVLDAGCGIGGSALDLARRFGCRVTGITLSANQVASATRHAERADLAGRVDFQRMDYLHTTFADNTFDVTWAVESACHAVDKAAFVREMARLLKPGGRLVMADGFTTASERSAYDHKLMRGWVEGWCVEALSEVDDMKCNLEKAGFRDITFRDITEHVMPSSKLLHRIAWPFVLLLHISGFLSKRMRIRAKNAVAMCYQYRALKRGLWRYGIFSATRA